MQTTRIIVLSLFLIGSHSCYLTSMDIVFNSENTFPNIPELHQKIFFDYFPYSFNAHSSPTEVHNALMTVSLVNTDLYQYLNNKKVTHIIINNISCGRNQNILAKKINTPGMKNYLKKSTILYKYIPFMAISRIKRLLREGADPNFFPKKEKKQHLQIPLLFRTLYNYRKTKKLLNAGADINVAFKTTGKTALQHSIEQNRVNIVKLLLKYNPQQLFLSAAIWHGNHKIINAILQQTTITQKELNNGLRMAIIMKDKPTVKKIAAAGVNLDECFADMKQQFAEMIKL